MIPLDSTGGSGSLIRSHFKLHRYLPRYGVIVLLSVSGQAFHTEAMVA